MVSNALASLDEWLARAEQVIEEQREQALPPSLAPWDRQRMEVVIPLGDFEKDLEGLLGDLCWRPPGPKMPACCFAMPAFVSECIPTEDAKMSMAPRRTKWSIKQFRL